MGQHKLNYKGKIKNKTVKNLILKGRKKIIIYIVSYIIIIHFGELNKKYFYLAIRKSSKIQNKEK
jgi:hypothetical protein